MSYQCISYAQAAYDYDHAEDPSAGDDEPPRTDDDDDDYCPLDDID